MKKGKLLALGLIGLLMVIGLVLISCDEKDICNGKCYYDPNSTLGSKGAECYGGLNDAKCSSTCAAEYARKTLLSYRVNCDCK
jgi:hypothetical protein